jgi:hypothetical protein
MTCTANILALVQNFDRLPDDAVVGAEAAAQMLDLSPRTVRNHPFLPRRYTSIDRYGFRVGDIRKLVREGVPVEARRIRSVRMK